MLVVTRKVGERIIVGDNITVSVERISGGLVRIGIEAPADYTIVRRELMNRPEFVDQEGVNQEGANQDVEVTEQEP